MTISDNQPTKKEIEKLYREVANLRNVEAHLRQEIAERERAEAALTQNQMQFEAFFSQSLDGCFFMLLDEPLRWDDDTDKDAALDHAFVHQRITKINRAMLDQYGAEEAAFIGLTPTDLMSHDIEYGRQLWRTLFDNGRISLESDERKLDGTPMWVEGEYVCLYDGDGRIIGHFGIQREVTKRKQAAIDLQASQTMLRLVLDNIPQAVFWKDRKSVYLGCNQEFANDAGIADPADIIGLTDYDLPWTREEAKFFRTIDQQVMENNQPQYNLEEPQTQAGKETTSWLLTNKIPLHGANDLVVGILGTYADITEIKNTQEALRRSEEMYRRIVNTAEEGIWVLDAQGNTTFVNNKMATMLQYRPDEMIGHPLFDFINHKDKQKYTPERLQQRIQSGREHRDFKFERKDGSYIWTIISISPIKTDDGRYTGAVGMVTDITQRRQVEKNLEKYINRLEILRYIENAILNAQSTRAIAHELLTRLHEIIPFVQGTVLLIDWKAQTAKALACISQVDTGMEAGTQHSLHEIGFIEKIAMGKLFYESDLNNIESPSLVIQQIKRTGASSMLGVPLVAQGQVIGMTVVGGTQQNAFTIEHIEIIQELAHSLAVAVEQAQLREQIQQHTIELEQRVLKRTYELQKANERLKEMDYLKSKFISDVTHELRTPVTNMLLYLDLLRLGKADNFERYHQVLKEQTERLRQLVEDSLDLTRLDLAQGDISLLWLELNSLVSQAVTAVTQNAERKNITLNLAPTPLPPIPMDGGQISRVMAVLLNNAINFTPAGQVYVSTQLDDTAALAGIMIQDTGIGFAEKDLEHCFEPFYRGENVGQLNIPGNGLGLTLAKRIVDLHNGRIEIQSTLGKGSTVTVWLPLKQ